MRSVYFPVLLCLATALNCQAQSPNTSEPDFIVNRPATFRLGMENITLPGNEKMGMVGASYLLETTPGLYFGPAFYGSNTGERGGFFTGGVELAYRARLFAKAEVETGVYVGGGGGGSSMVGGGLMLRPHADLLWNFGVMRAGISLSSVRFPNGKIQSNQIGVVAAFDDIFRQTSTAHTGETSSYQERGGIGFDRISVLGGTYKPRPGVTDLAGNLTEKKIGFAGFRADQFISEYWLWGIEAAGAASGSADGYAEVLGSLGVEVPLLKNWLSIGARGSLGMGGGGAVSAGGGSLAKAGLYSTLKLNRDYFVTAEGGVARSPGGQFRANYGTLQLGVMLDHPYFGSDSAPRSQVEAWEWSVSAQHYLGAARRDGSERPMEVIGFKMNRQVDKSLYYSGQAHSATTGGAGGYSVGLFGAGWKTPKTDLGLSAAAELMIGAAGGGGIQTKGGAITQPMLYGVADLNRNWNLKAGVGKIRSIKGSLNSTVLDVSLGYSFGLPAR